ncbi:putative tudor domain-containing protein 6, partial [Triplophysa rosa]
WVCLSSVFSPFSCFYRSKEESNFLAPFALWPVELKLTHIDCSSNDTLVHFQGHYMTICELDYNILQVEIQNAVKTKASIQLGELCLVEDPQSGRWYRGRVQIKENGLYHVFLMDHGDVLTVGPNNLSMLSDTLRMLPPKIVCGFFANILPVQKQWNSLTENYFSSLIGSQINGYIHARLPYQVLILEVPDIKSDLLKLKLAKHVDTSTFLLLVEMLIEIPIKQSNESVPDLLIEKQMGQEYCLKSSNLPGFEEILSLNGPKLKVGQKVEAFVTAAVNSGLFYCRLTSMGKDAQKMSQRLVLECESGSVGLSNKVFENLGLLCAVKGKDEKWHRGVVQCLPISSHVRVMFIDSGYCESVKVENILQLPSEFLSTPIMAVPCSLSCLGGQDDAVKKQQMETLKSALLGKSLEVAVDGFCKDQNFYLVTLNVTENHPEEQVEDVESSKSESKPSFPLSKWYAAETKKIQKPDRVSSDVIQDDSLFEGYVIHVQNPKSFWIRTKAQNCKFEEMMKEITEYFSKVQLNEEIFEDPVPGVLCCAMYENDLHYYRALVVDTLENGAEVFFIDFGNTEKVPVMLIKKLPKKFALEPEYAMNCALAHIAPLEDSWTAVTSDFFRQVTSNKTLQVHVIHRRNGKYIVELFEEEGGSKIDVAKETTKPKVTATEIFKPMHFKPGCEVNVICSHVNSPSDFWCQNKSTKGDLDKMMEEMQTFYQMHMVPFESLAACCAVKCPQDNRWYRACMLSQDIKDISVILVDYGVVLKERMPNVQALASQFFELKEQGFRCSLNQTEPVGRDAWSAEACNLFKDFVSEDSSELTCQINSQLYEQGKGLFNVVNIRKPFLQATAYLLEKGVAVETQTPKQLTSSVYPRSFVYSSFNLSSGSEELVYVTSISSPWEIYFQLNRNTEIVDKLMKRVAEESQLLSTTSEDCSGNVCLARYFCDGHWYRALAQPVQSPKHLSVFFVDYGNKQLSEKIYVMPIPRRALELLMTPMQALRCSLYDVTDGEHLPEVNAWLETAVLNRSLKAKIVTRDNSGHFVCDLYDGDVHVNKKVKELIATYGVKECDSCVSKPTSKTGSKQRSKPKKPPKTERNKAPNKGTVPKQRNTSCSPKVNLPKLSDLPDIKMKPGSKGVGFISHCDSGRFFIQMEDDEPSILQMCEELNAAVLKDNMKRVTSEVKVGDLIAVEFEEDMTLYRAVVTKLLSCRQLQVEFVDYGNTATIDRKNIVLLTNVFLSQPRLSTPCVLEKYHSLQNEAFVKEAVGKPLMVKFVQKHGSSWKVNVEVLEGGNKLDQRKDASLPLPDKSPIVSQNKTQKYDVRMLKTKSEAPVQRKTKPVQVKNNPTFAMKQKIKAVTYKRTFEKPKSSWNKKCRRTQTVSKPETLVISKQKCDTSATKTEKIPPENVSTCNANAVETPRCATLSQTNVKESKAMYNLKELLADHIASSKTCTESSVNNADQTQTLFHAPVQMNADYKGFAAAVTTPAEFYIILEDHLLILETVSAVLENLQEVMVPFPDAHLIPGACCLVKMSEKEKWCRAELVQWDSSSVLINLVDYGQYAVLSQQEISQLKQLPKELAGLPKVTYHCLLRGVKPNDQDWSDEAVIFFQNCMCRRNLHIRFRQHVSETQWEVDITTENQNLAKLLVDAGLATYIDSMLGIRFQQEMEITKQSCEADSFLKEVLSKMNVSDEPMFDGKSSQEFDGHQEATDHLNSRDDFGPHFIMYSNNTLLMFSNLILLYNANLLLFLISFLGALM